jgi:hypothetical protein
VRLTHAVPLIAAFRDIENFSLKVRFALTLTIGEKYCFVIYRTEA